MILILYSRLNWHQIRNVAREEGGWLGKTLAHAWGRGAKNTKILRENIYKKSNWISKWLKFVEKRSEWGFRLLPGQFVATPLLQILTELAAWRWLLVMVLEILNFFLCLLKFPLFMFTSNFQYNDKTSPIVLKVRIIKPPRDAILFLNKPYLFFPEIIF